MTELRREKGRGARLGLYVGLRLVQEREKREEA